MTHPLTQYIERSGVGRTALARRAETSRQTIHRIERGEQSPSLDLVRRIITATGDELGADDFLPPRASAA
jgi:DNA-binding XRE family transcriptional regulator